MRSLTFKISLVLLMIITFSESVYGQGERIQPYYRVFNFNNTLPDHLLSDRSVAFVEVDQENKGRTVWKDLSQQFHQGIATTGTDVIGYFNIMDVFAGLETRRYFSEDFVKRGVKNIIWIRQRGAMYTMIVTPFNENLYFMDQGQSAWRVEGGDVMEMLAVYRRAVGGSGQLRKNFLMTDVPEFFEDTRMISRNRYEVFNADLKLDKLAIPTFMPMRSTAAVEGIEGAEMLEAYGRQWRRDSATLAEIFEIYPFEYALIDAEFEEKKLRDEGFQFILYSLHTSGRVIHDLMNYSNDKNVTEYVTVKKWDKSNEVITIPVHQPVYKFYIKHIFSGEIFLGESWDADLTWDEALRNHLAGMREKVRK